MNWYAELLDDIIATGADLGAEKVEELRAARDRLAQGASVLPRHRATDEIMGEIDEAETLDQVAAVFGRMPQEYGFNDATLIILSEGKSCLSRRVISSLPAAWWDDYNRLGLSEDDPVIGGITSQEHELFLDELVPTHDAPLRYLRAAEAHNIGCNGVIFKVSYHTGLVAAVVLNTVKTPDYARRQFRMFREDLHLLAHAVCDALVYFSQVGTSNSAPLTPEEIRFLRLVAMNEDPAAALEMKCSFGSPQTLQMQVIRKLGVKSIFQAVMVASRQGLIDTALLHPDEIIPTRPKITGWDLASQWQEMDTEIPGLAEDPAEMPGPPENRGRGRRRYT
ncbi:autoinducer binding domain-containing protein [uncultured Roseobacter sp.]|uniref:autoinducer binding domain-containing protein n=1 Tax=uncultured Roseobacter sp. TaxID=114847 RepID=UPI002611DF4C|nr:autoinducer binding domain-containing protein [uncultured Roseobacter sp.]